MNRKKLIHVTASLDHGGAETVLFSLVRGLQPWYDQQVISFRDGYFNERICALGVPVHVLPAGFLPRIIMLHRVVRNQCPDLIHSLLWSSNALMRCYARLTKIPLVCAVHSPFNTNIGNSAIRAFIDRLTAAWATKTVFVAQNVRDQSQITAHVPAERRVVIVNGIDLVDVHSLAAQKKERSELGLTAQDFVLGTVGRLVPVKNQFLLIKLVELLREKYPTIRLIIVGHGPLYHEFSTYIREHDLQNHVFLMQGVGAAYYQLFDCFVLPSKTEGLSMALLEAMSFKLPVLVAHTAGAAGVIESGGNGLIFEPENLGELMALVEQLIRDSELCGRLGTQAQKTVQEHFSVETVVDAYQVLFDKITHG